MQVIPVIDVKSGVVVHAVGGDRDRYRPIESRLAESAEPVAVVAGLRRLFVFDALYIADLDGIAGRGRDIGVVRRLRSAWPELEIWVDNGSTDAADITLLAGIDGVRPVVGSETLQDVDQLDQIVALSGVEPILSLDFKGDCFLGPESLLGDTERWPRAVIAMTLAAVGAAAGPDLVRVARLKAAKPTALIIAAGGVRDMRDLRNLADAGAAAALVATALHSGTLKAGDLKEIAGLRAGSKCS